MGEGLPQGRVLVATVLVNLGLAGIVGAWASLLWLRVAGSPWARRAGERSWAALRTALAVAVVADALLLWVQAAYMAELPLLDAVAILPLMAWQTYAGHAWAGGAAGLLLLVGVASRGTAPRRGILPLAVVALGVGMFVYSRATVSHAGDRGLASVALLVDCLHLGAISLWLGVVGVAAFVVLRATQSETTGKEDVADWIGCLSSSATSALGVIAFTGVLNAWRGMGSTSHLVDSPYGNALLVKVGFVAIAAALGAFNRIRVMPSLLAALQAPQGSAVRPQQRFVQVLRLEAVVLLAALIAAAVLGASPLPTTT